MFIHVWSKTCPVPHSGGFCPSNVYHHHFAQNCTDVHSRWLGTFSTFSSSLQIHLQPLINALRTYSLASNVMEAATSFVFLVPIYASLSGGYL